MNPCQFPSARLKTLTAEKLDFYASKRWPQLEKVTIRWHCGCGYVTDFLPSDEELPLCRLHYLGSDTERDFTLYQDSSETYEEALQPNGLSGGTPQEALDCAASLYLADPTAWIKPPDGLMRRCTSAAFTYRYAALMVSAGASGAPAIGTPAGERRPFPAL